MTEVTPTCDPCRIPQDTARLDCGEAAIEREQFLRPTRNKFKRFEDDKETRR